MYYMYAYTCTNSCLEVLNYNLTVIPIEDNFCLKWKSVKNNESTHLQCWELGKCPCSSDNQISLYVRQCIVCINKHHDSAINGKFSRWLK